MSTPRRLALASLTFALAVTWLAAQPPRKEEEEPPAKEKEKARPVVPVPVTEPDKKDGVPSAAPGDPVDPDVGSFKEELAKTTNPDAKVMFRELLVPYDRIEPNFQGGFKYRIELLPERDLPEGEFTVNILDVTLKKVFDTKKIATGSGFKYTPFEEIVLEQVNAFLEKDPIGDLPGQLDLAARAVAAGLRWHLHAKDTNKRQGKGWDATTRRLKYRLLELQRDRFAALLSAKRYAEADELGLKMMSRNPDNADIMRDVYRLNLLRLDRTVKDPTDAQLLQLRESLLAYQRLQGKKDDGLVKTVQDKLRNRATALVGLAKAADQEKRAAEALALLRKAEGLDPDAPGIEDVRQRLRGKVLYVGVNRLPERMSPATARTDAEKWAVELMFEGLLEAVPDSEVIRYRPALAETMPTVMPLGRAFSLPRNVRWGRDDPGDALDVRDVRDTLDLLRRPELRYEWPVDGVDVFQEIDRLDDNVHLRLAYQRGVLEPLSRATFKVIPARWLKERGKGAADDDFARNPFGTGPFRYEGREKEGLDRECAVFRSNPHYGQRAGKLGLPWIREVRMYVPTPSTLARDVTSGQLHIDPDAPLESVLRFRTEDGLRDVMRVYTAKSNRRVHILAVNHRVTNLQNDKVRQGLSALVDRPAILKAVYQLGDERAHAPLTGPFPVRSWATPPTARDAPLSKPGGGGLIQEGLGNQPIHLRLTCEKDDAQARAACQLIKKQVEQGTLNAQGNPLVQIDVRELAAVDYRNKLYLEHDFDLALTTFDYRDDLYSLAGLLDPEAVGPDGRGGRNFLGFLAPGTNPAGEDRRLWKLIDEARSSRDFSKKVQRKTWDIHALFNQRLPFIPLWQLDRYMVVHKDLEMYFDDPEARVTADQLDPATVFTGVEMWRVK